MLEDTNSLDGAHMMYVEGRLHQETGNLQYQNQNRPVYHKFTVYTTNRFKAVVPMLFLFCGAL